MGEIDTYQNDYLDNNRRFADLANGVLYQGRQIIPPEELEDIDPELVYAEDNGSKKTVRDKVKLWRGTFIVILSVENQNYVDYRMVTRNMLTKSMAYYRQWKKKAAEHREKDDLMETDEFLSEMKCYEKFIPVITIVVYYGTKKMWDGARTLHELLDMGDHEELIKPYISNYRLNLYDFHEEDSFDRFQTELGTLFEFLRYSTDRSALLQRMEQNPERYSHVDRETGRLIAKLTGIKELKEAQDKTMEGEVNMCKAFEDMKLEGIAEGQKITAINQIKKKLAKGMSTPEIADMLELDTTYVGEVLSLINKYPNETSEQLATRLSCDAITI